MDNTVHNEQMVQMITAIQPRLYAFVLSLVGDVDEASDVLQETNIKLWQNQKRFESGTNFAAWAMSVAKYQVMTLRGKRRTNKVTFDDDLLDQLTNKATSDYDQFDSRMRALRHCIEKLPDGHRKLIDQRYRQEISVKSIAEGIKRSAFATAQLFYRIRMALADCIRTRMSQEDQP